MLSNPRDVALNASTTFNSVTVDANYIYVCSSTPNLRKYNPDTLEEVSVISTIVSNNSGICLITPATAVITSSSATQVDFVDINTGARTQKTTGAAGATYSGVLEGQIACNQNTGIAMATRNADSTILKIDSAQTLTSLTPTPLSGSRASTIIVKQSTGSDPQRWIVGTNNGKIYEIDASGTVSKTISLPLAPNVTGAPTNVTVTGLAHYPPNLICSTSYGSYYIYEYESGTLIYSTFAGGVSTVNNPNNGLLCCIAASGLTYFGPSNAPSDTPIDEVYFASPNPSINCFSNNDGLSGSGIQKMVIHPTKRLLIVTSNTSSFARMRVYDINKRCITRTTESTELHDPPGSQITGRVIRIRLGDGYGRSCIEDDKFVVAGTDSLQATDGVSYIDLAINSANTKWDIREFDK